jgi:WD40 repeat protein
MTASDDKTARLWSLDAGAAAGRPLLGSVAFAAAFSADGADVVRLLGDGTTQTTDASSGEARATSPPPREGLEAVALADDGQRRVLLLRSDSTVQVWETRSGSPVGPPIRHRGENQALKAQLSADAMTIVTSYDGVQARGPQQKARDGAARVWDVQTGQGIGGYVPVKPDYRIDSVAADGRMIVTGPDNAAQIWDARSGQPVGGQLRHHGRINAASFSRNGNYIVTTSDDETARVWDGRSGLPMTEPLRHRGAVQAARFSPDGRRIVTSSGPTMSIWDAESGKALGRRLRHDQAIVAAAFSADNQRIVTVSANGVTHVWDVAVDATTRLPDWVPELAEALGGQRFNDAGLLVPAKSIIALRNELMTAGAARELTGDDFWSRFGRWFFTRGAERTISPNTRITAGERDGLRRDGAASRSAR